MGQVARFKLAKAPPTKARRVDRLQVLVAADLVVTFERRVPSRSVRAGACIGVYAPHRSSSIH